MERLWISAPFDSPLHLPAVKQHQVNEARFEVQLGWAFRWQQPQWTSQWKLRRDSRQKLSSQARSEFLSQKILPRVKQLFYFKLGVNLSSINKKLEHLQHSWFLLHPLGSFCGGEVRWGQGCRVSLTFSEGFFGCLFWFFSGFFFFFFFFCLPEWHAGS